MDILLLGLLLVLGVLAGNLGSSLLGVPRVLGYLLVGILFSPSLLGGALSLDLEQAIEPMVAVALGAIAFLVGGSATVDQLRRLGPTITGATLGKVIGAFLAVFVVFLLIAPLAENRSNLQLAVVLAAVATITAPATLIAIVHQYRAVGPLTTTLLGMVALDDALGIVLFSLVLALVGSATLVEALPWAAWEIAGALMSGVTAGWLVERMLRSLHEQELRMVLLVGAIILLVGLAEAAHFSALLAAMTFGFVARWRGGPRADRVFEPVEQLEELLFVLFFALAGLHFSLDLVMDNLWLILGFFVVRALGQMAGGYAGARLVGAGPMIANHVGLGMLPQGGVAIGMALMVAGEPGFEQVGDLVVNVVTASTILTESVGALAARYGLYRAGELGRGIQNGH
ncbi:MAG: cation:proton antiporter [Halothiobacillaceae bacterium]